MNRYRTIPGLGPSSSKATSTTTCQKCLQKGHYSYECKSSVQSRPYISRPSRSQQLQNPKLKPRLAEQKMEEPEVVSETVKQSLENQDTKVDEPATVTEQSEHDLTSRKRPRSASVSSRSSVATISTDASRRGARNSRPVRSGSNRRRTRSRSSSASRSGSISRRRNTTVSNHHRENRDSHSSGSPAHRRSDESHRTSESDEAEVPAGRHAGRQDHEVSSDRHRHDRRNKRRRSLSADNPPGTRRHANDFRRPPRQRSLSPYSRRLALTQAMNSGS